MHYTVWNPAGICVAEYDADSPVLPSSIEEGYAGFVTKAEDGSVIEQSDSNRKLTVLEFLRRFTAQERVVARTLAKTDPVVEDFLALLSQAQDVQTSDPDTVAGMDYLVQTNVLTAERRDQILGD